MTGLYRWTTKNELKTLSIKPYKDTPFFVDDSANNWYFADETWVNLCGPFNSMAEARYFLVKYVEGL